MACISAKVMATLLLTQRATAFVFQGEELGMSVFIECREVGPRSER